MYLICGRLLIITTCKVIKQGEIKAVIIMSNSQIIITTHGGDEVVVVGVVVVVVEEYARSLKKCVDIKDQLPVKLTWPYSMIKLIVLKLLKITIPKLD